MPKLTHAHTFCRGVDPAVVGRRTNNRTPKTAGNRAYVHPRAQNVLQVHLTAYT